MHLAAGVAAAGPPTFWVEINGRRTTYKGVAALRYVFEKRRDFPLAEKFAYRMLWKNIEDPESLFILARSVDLQRRPQEAAVYFTLLLRVLAKSEPAMVRKYKSLAERRLKLLNKEYDQRKAAFIGSAPGKRFVSPEQVDDGWMMNVEADLFGLHSLYAWKLVGGRTKGVKPDWIHNAQGRMHRSGLKLCDEVDGRKSVLFGVPIRAKPRQGEHPGMTATIKRLGHPTQVRTWNVGRCRFLRVGTKAYGFPYGLKVYADGAAGSREIFSQRIDVQRWSDLKIELPRLPELPELPRPSGTQPARRQENRSSEPKPSPAGTAPEQKHQQVVLELVVPQQQRWSEGVWLDYVDFFDN